MSALEVLLIFWLVTTLAGVACCIYLMSRKRMPWGYECWDGIRLSKRKPRFLGSPWPGRK